MLRHPLYVMQRYYYACLPACIARAPAFALVLTISHDGKVSPDEAELPRAICATLHCPLPPFVFNAGGI